MYGFFLRLIELVIPAFNVPLFYYLGSGDDEVHGASHVYNYIDGGDGNDWLYGNVGDDDLVGGNGVDYLAGGDGNDRLYGGNDSDTLDGEAGDDMLYGEYGNDTLDGDTGNDHLFGGFGDDTLIGGVGDDVVQGGVGRDKIYGGDGDDELYGNLGGDTFFGGDGHDAMNGGDGNDIFYIDGKDLTEDKIVGGDGNDTMLLTIPTTVILENETNHIFGIDFIDASNAPLDVTLTPQDILDMTDAGMLTIMGGADDNVVSIGFGWTTSSSMQDNGHNYNRYECKLNGQDVYLNVEDTIGIALS